MSNDPVIFTYTAEQALADGVLMDARQGDIAEVTDQHVKQGLPVYIAQGLNQLIQEAVDHPKMCNDWRGVWHDVLTMWGHTVRRSKGSTSRLAFEVIITGTGRATEIHRVFAVLDGAGLTFMLPEDY